MKYDTRKRHPQPEQVKVAKTLTQRKTNEVRSLYSRIAFALRCGKDDKSLLFAPQVLWMTMPLPTLGETKVGRT